MVERQHVREGWQNNHQPWMADVSLHGSIYGVFCRPLPHVVSKTIMNLEQKIQQEIINQGGFLPFSDFMQLALYSPGIGYYTRERSPVGAAGDFITAPTMGTLFSKCLAQQCAQVLREIPHGVILECGAGNGDMAAQLLLALESLQCLPRQYWILELGAGLKKIQEQTLQNQCPHLLPRVVWLSTLPTQSFEGVIVGNEVMDALPLTLFEFCSEENILERGVGLDAEGKCAWTTREASLALKEQVSALNAAYGPWPEHYSSEISLLLQPWLASLSQHFKRGVMLWIDYGERAQEIYHPSRQGSLRCYEAHQLCDSPLEHIGQRDITADVNFTALGQAAFALGLECVGYSDQSLFLMNCQLEQIMQQTIQAKPEALLKIQAEARQLVHPTGGGMGQRFKVMALTQDYETSLIGFAQGNRVVYL